MASKGEAPWPLRRRAGLGCPSSPGRQPGVWAPQRPAEPAGPRPPAAGPAPRPQSARCVLPLPVGAADPRSVSLRPWGPRARAEVRAEERRRAVPVTPSIRPAGSSEVLLPPDPILAAATAEGDGVFCAQLQCFHFPTLRHHDLHSWRAESCQDKSSFLCKRSERGPQPQGLTPGGLSVHLTPGGLSVHLTPRGASQCT